MSIAQLITLAIAGPLAIMCLLKLSRSVVFKEVVDFEIVHAVILMVCTIAFVIVFVGIK